MDCWGEFRIPMKLSKKDLEQIQRFALVLFGVSIGLLGEHIIGVGYIEFGDLLGHETYGLVGMLISWILLGVVHKLKPKAK